MDLVLYYIAKYGQGGGSQKYRKFCVHPLCNVPDCCSFWKLALFLVLFIVMSEVFGRVDSASALFNEFKESFRLSEYYVVDGAADAIPEGKEPELQLENFPKKVIITQVRDINTGNH